MWHLWYELNSWNHAPAALHKITIKQIKFVRLSEYYNDYNFVCIQRKAHCWVIFVFSLEIFVGIHITMYWKGQLGMSIRALLE